MVTKPTDLHATERVQRALCACKQLIEAIERAYPEYHKRPSEARLVEERMICLVFDLELCLSKEVPLLEGMLRMQPSEAV